MKANFQTALRHVLEFEGGYVDHPNDPGGATNMGITRATLARYRGRPVSKGEVRGLNRDTASGIYRQFYWDALVCDEMPGGIDLAVFDGAVNHGPARSARFLQTALKVSADGIVGPVTLNAVASAPPRELLIEFMALRMRAYGRLSRLFRTFGLGWSRRLMAVHSAAHALITERQEAPQEEGAPQPNSPTADDRQEHIMRFLIERLREPSTYAGVAAFLAGLGLFGLSENEWNQIFGAIASVAGVVAMFMRDGLTGAQDPDSRPASGQVSERSQS